MKKLILIAVVGLLLTAGSIACSQTQAAQVSPASTHGPDAPKYTADQVIAVAVSRPGPGLPSCISWNFAAEYLPAQPDLKLKGVWRVEQSGVDPTQNDAPINAVRYFHEDTGTFTDAR